jgi:O-antigen ligase
VLVLARNTAQVVRDPIQGRTQRSGIAVPVILALVLLFSLAPLRRASMISNHTWRVELGVALFLIVAYLFGRARPKPGSRNVNSILLCLILFAGWSLFSAVWAYSAASAWHHTIVWGVYCLMLAWVLSLGSEARPFVVRTVSIIACFIVALAVIDYVTVPDFSGALEGSIRMRYGAYGELLVTGVPMLWALALYRRSAKNWLLALLPAAAGWTAAMLSLSKGVFIAGIVGCVFTFALSTILLRSRRRQVLITAGIWVLLTVTVQMGSSFLTVAPATVDYLSGTADADRASSIARVFMWKVGAVMAREHWLLGVGADNFGIEFNGARADYRLTHPTEPPTEINSDYLVERAHNEPLQVIAELGVVGLAILALPFILFSRQILKRVRDGWKPGPLFMGAIGGMLAFAASSMVSSFSFRIIQNGIVFFLVFAVAIYGSTRRAFRERDTHWLLRSPAPAVFLMAAILSLGLKAAAEYSFAMADRESDIQAATNGYRRAYRLDPDYAAALYRIGDRGCGIGSKGSADEFRRSLREGVGVVVTYSKLSDCYEREGDTRLAQASLEDGLKIFPRSTFLRVRYGLLLAKSGLDSLAEDEFTAARKIDVRQANGWYELLTQGSVRAFYAARADAAIAPPAELIPNSAVLLYLDKTPGERPE